MTAYEIPLSANPQTLSVNLAGAYYNLTVKWNAQNTSWVLDIADSNNNPLVQGIALVTGADLLEQYAYIGIGGQLQVQTDSDTFAVPTIDNLGTDSHLYFIV